MSSFKITTSNDGYSDFSMQESCEKVSSFECDAYSVLRKQADGRTYFHNDVKRFKVAAWPKYDLPAGGFAYVYHELTEHSVESSVF